MIYLPCEFAANLSKSYENPSTSKENLRNIPANPSKGKQNDSGKRLSENHIY